MTTPQTIAQIGQKYATSFFTGGGFSKTSLTLSTDRIAGVGKTYTAASKGIVSFAAPLKEVSSLGIEYKSNYTLLILGVLLLALGIFLPSFLQSDIKLLFLGLGIMFVVAYVYSKERYIVINIKGFAYALSLRGISNKEVGSFIDTTIQTVSISE